MLHRDESRAVSGCRITGSVRILDPSPNCTHIHPLRSTRGNLVQSGLAFSFCGLSLLKLVLVLLLLLLGIVFDFVFVCVIGFIVGLGILFLMMPSPERWH